MKKQSLIIVGAGAAGLMAAKNLSLYFDVTVLEASARIGGRIHSVAWENDLIEGGAEFIHGNMPLTLKLLHEAGISYIPVEGKMYRKENAGLVAEQDQVEGWDGLLKKMKHIKSDMSLQDFLDKYYSGTSYTIFKKRVIAYAEGFDVADIAAVSVRSLYKEWSAEEEDTYRIPFGYEALLANMQQQAIEDNCKFIFNEKVKLVQWKQNYVAVHTTGNQALEANKLLITVPLIFLYEKTAKAFIEFDPPIEPYAEAAKDIGLGSVVKVILKFKESFWPQNTGFIFSDEKFFPTWWTQLPNNKAILTGWMGGPEATIISNEEKHTILQKAVMSLASIFYKPVEEIEAALSNQIIFNWQADYDSLPGAYSFDKVGSPEAREILNTPLFKTIYFAGEALYNGAHPGTVEAALTSGEQAAERIRSQL